MSLLFRSKSTAKLAAGSLAHAGRNSARAARPTSTPVAITQFKQLHISSRSNASYRRFGEQGEPQPPSGREQLSGGEAIRRQLEDQLFRRVGVPQSRSQQPSQYQRFGAGGGGGKGSGGSRFTSRPPTLILVALGGAGIYYVVHLEKVPETGRWRFIDVSPAQEHELGQETFKQTLGEYRDRILPASHPHSKQVRAVASRIVAALDKAVDGSNQPHHTKGDPYLTHHSHGEEGGISYGGSNAASSQQQGKPATKWEVFVIDDPKQKNAFVLPGGKIFVFTGILPVCANADGLATVLGHEVAHQVARHSAEKMSGYKVLLFERSSWTLLA